MGVKEATQLPFQGAADCVTCQVTGVDMGTEKTTVGRRMVLRGAGVPVT